VALEQNFTSTRAGVQEKSGFGQETKNLVFAFGALTISSSPGQRSARLSEQRRLDLQAGKRLTGAPILGEKCARHVVMERKGLLLRD
jgi:hypothetical protein